MPRRIEVQFVSTGSGQITQALNSIKYEAREAATIQGNALRDALANSSPFKNVKLFAGTENIGGFPQGLKTETIKTQFSALNNTIKITERAIITTKDGLQILGAEMTRFTGNVQEVLKAESDFGIALVANDQKLEATAIAVDALAESYRGLIAQQTRAAETAGRGVVSAQTLRDNASTRVEKVATRLSAADQAVLTARQNLADAQALSPRGPNGQFSSARGIAIEKAEAKLSTALEKQAALVDRKAVVDAELITREETLSTAQAKQASTTETLAATNAQLAAQTEALAGPILAERAAIVAAGEANVQSAVNRQSPVPSALQVIRSESPQALERLQKLGLGAGAKYGSPQFVSNLQEQGAYDSINISRDLVTKVTRVSGVLKDLNATTEAGRQVAQRFGLEYNNEGTVLTKFGGQVSGVGNILSQLSRNFQKVIEFAVATTLVFGTMQYAIKELSAISTIDKNIRQLSITANLTHPEAVGLFEDISKIAYETATPLADLTKATDDIALSTRKAGQSTDQWKESILSLTQSVGILTNLAGIDTVEATDQLVSTMKQLNLQADELPGLLSKITAVAGGQSGAIADVVKGLGVMAEAGKQGALNIDQMIGLVQTLSQVTSKTPDEVATALKNLVGSLGGPAALKALSAYNIELRDTHGNLRNIVEIYTEISDKISKGIIPQADVQGLVRAISGGPRRAPDAAALLANIGSVNEVAARSLTATNEALIANAKSLDTVAAKFVQLQVLVDKFATTKFADVLKRGAGDLASFLSSVLGILNLLPSSFYVAISQMVIFAGLARVLLSIGTYLGGTFKGIASGLKELGLVAVTAGARFGSFRQSVTASTEAELANTAATRQNALSSIFGSRSRFQFTQAFVASTEAEIANTVATEVNTARTLSGTLKSALGNANKYKLAIAGGIVAGAIGGATGDASGAVGGGLQTAGILALSIPEPTGVTKALGAIAIAAGFAVQALDLFGDKNKEIAQDERTQAEAISNALSAYKDASDVVTNLTKEQDRLGASLDTLNAKQNKSTADNKQLISYQDDYAINASKLIDANDSLSESFTKLSDVLKGSKFDLAAANSGAFSADQVKDLTQRLAPEILKASNPNFVAPDDIKDFLIKTIPGTYAQTGSNTQSYNTAKSAETAFGIEGGLIVQQQGAAAEELNKSLDLAKLKTDANAVKQLFNEAGTAFSASFSPTYENLQLIDSALKQIQGSMDPKVYKAYQQTFQDYASSVDALYGIERKVAIGKAYIEAGGATGLFTPEEVKQGEAIYDLYNKIGHIIPTIAKQKFGNGPDDRDRQREYAQSLQDQLYRDLFDSNTGQPKETLDKNSALSAGKTLLEKNGLYGQLFAKGGERLVDKTIAETFKSIGVEVDGLTNSLDILGAAADENLSQLQTDLDKLQADTLTNVATKLADLKAQQQAGAFNGKPDDTYLKARDQLTALDSAAKGVIPNYIEATNTIGALSDELLTLKDRVSGIAGLQDAANLSAGDFVKRLYDLAGTYNLNAEQITTLSGTLQNLLGLYKQFDDVRANPLLKTAGEEGKGISSDPRKAILDVQNAREKLLASPDFTTGEGGREKLAAYDALLNVLQGVDDGTNKAQDDINKLFDTPSTVDTKLHSALEDIGKTYSDRQLQLQTDINAGNFKHNAAGLKALSEQYDTAYDSENKLAKAMASLSSGGFQRFVKGLSQIKSLTYLSTLDTTELADAQDSFGTVLIENAIKAGVNAKGLDEITLAALRLAAAIQALPTYHEIDVQIKTYITGNANIPVSVSSLAAQSAAEYARTHGGVAALEKAAKDNQKNAYDDFLKKYKEILSSAKFQIPKSGGSTAKKKAAEGNDVSSLDIPDEIAKATNRDALIQEAIKRARKLQSTIPGETKEAKNDIVAILQGTKNLENVRGIKETYLTKALQELADIEKKRLDFETKADTIRRIRVGAGDFSAIANVPVNSRTGVSLGGANGPVNVTLNLNGTILTPAQLSQFADLIAASLKRQIATG